MNGDSVQFGQVFLVFIVTSGIAAVGVLVGALAFRKNHYLIDCSNEITRRFGRASGDAGGEQDQGRLNLIGLSVFLLWLSLMVCIFGIRLAIA